jgi:threonine dehydrogenase-like Zn-dependent dehydrogenase
MASPRGSPAMPCSGKALERSPTSRWRPPSSSQPCLRGRRSRRRSRCRWQLPPPCCASKRLGWSQAVRFSSTAPQAGSEDSRSKPRRPDLVGNRLLQDLRRSVRPGGRLVLSGGGTPGNRRFVGPLRLLIGAMAVARFQPFEVTVRQSVPDARTLAHVADLVVSGSLRPLIDRTVSLEDAAAALRYVETDHPRGEVVLTKD